MTFKYMDLTKDAGREFLNGKPEGFFVFSDLHISSRFGGLDYLPFCEELLNKVSQSEAESLFLGDMFDVSKPTASEALVFTEWLHDCREREHEVSLLEGNHTVSSSTDCSYVTTLASAVDPEEYTARVYNENKQVWACTNNDSINLMFIPYSKRLSEEGYLKEVIAEFVEKAQRSLPEAKNVVLIHAAIDGCESDNGTKLFNVGIPLPKGTLEGVDLLLAGDFHRHQEIPNADGVPAYYVGAPSHMRFGDTFVPRVGFLSIEDGALTYRSIPSSALAEPITFYTVEGSDYDVKKRTEYTISLDDALGMAHNDRSAFRVFYEKSDIDAVSKFKLLKERSRGRVYDHGYANVAQPESVRNSFSQVNTPELFIADFKSYVRQHVMSSDTKDFMKILDEITGAE